MIFEEETLTYRELNCQSNQLAQHLRGLGVGPEVFVGIYMERSLELVLAVLGVLKAGGVCVPMDPSVQTFSTHQVGFLLQDSRMPVVLTQTRFLPDLPSQTIRTLCLDTEWEFLRTECQANSVNEVTADNLAFLFYTSGSTGVPKGVLTTHHAQLSHLRWIQKNLPLSEKDRYLLMQNNWMES